MVSPVPPIELADPLALVSIAEAYRAFDHWFVRGIRTATGPIGLGLIFVYSFLVAVVLPLPSEVVLAPAPYLRTGLSLEGNVAVIVAVSAVGKGLGSVIALKIGNEAKEFGPILRAFERSRFDVVEWSQKRIVRAAREYGYIGLALVLSVPAFPDTLSIYAFAVLEDDYVRFAAAAIAGGAGRLLVTLAAAGGVLAVV